MSKWSYIVGSILVETFSTEALKEIETILPSLPAITGSEGGADIFLNKLNGYNFYSDDGEHQTQILISIFGNLRDKTENETQKEFDEFMKRLKERFLVVRYSIEIK